MICHAWGCYTWSDEIWTMIVTLTGICVVGGVAVLLASRPWSPKRWFTRLRLRCVILARVTAQKRYERVVGFLDLWGPICPGIIPNSVGRLQDISKQIRWYDERIATLSAQLGGEEVVS